MKSGVLKAIECQTKWVISLYHLPQIRCTWIRIDPLVSIIVSKDYSGIAQACAEFVEV